MFKNLKLGAKVKILCLNSLIFVITCFSLFVKATDHSHAEEEELITKSKLKRTMEEEVEKDPTKPVHQVFKEQLAANGNTDPDVLPEFQNVSSLLHRRRRSLLPDIPESVEDVVIQGEWAQTWAGLPFLSYQDANWGITVFATNANIRILGRCQTVFLDGTFQSCPSPYGQVVSMHGLYHGRAIPLAICLCEGKTIGHYRAILRHLKQRIRDLTGRAFRPASVVCDFEQALITAVQTELRRSRVSGCYFHFTQSMWRRVQELGLSGRFKNYNGRL